MRNNTDILVFVDNSGSKEVFESFLALGSSYVHFATKDDAGFRKLDTNKFDLIMVEISQPLVSEVQFIDRLNQLNSKTPIVIVSEYFNETKNAVFGNKISEFIAKPFTLDKLYETVNDVLDPKIESASVKTKTTNEDCRRLSILYEISKSINSITNFDVLLNTLVLHATDAMNAERATLFVLDKDTDELWSRVGIGIERQEIRFSKKKGIAGHVVHTGQSLLIDNPYDHPSFNKDFDLQSGFVTKNLLCVPMKNIKGEIVGAFQLLNKRDKMFDKNDELFLSAMSASTAIALENTLLHEDKHKKYLEIQQLYDDMYVAQKMIQWESKHSTISEIRGYLSEIKQYDGISHIANDIVNDIKAEESVKEKVLKIKSAYDKTFVRVGQYMNHLINNLEPIDKKSIETPII